DGPQPRGLVKSARKGADVADQIIRSFQRREVTAFVEARPVRDVYAALDLAARRKRDEVYGKRGDTGWLLQSCAARNGHRHLFFGTPAIHPSRGVEGPRDQIDHD